MIKGGLRFTQLLVVIVGVVLADSGCASKKYVSRQIAPVNQRLNQYEKQTNDRLAWLNNKQQTDISRVNERLATTDMKVSEVATAVQQAQGSASRAMDEASAARTANAEAISKLETGVNDALNYKLIDTAEVNFAFDKATLTSHAKTTLDEVVVKFRSSPRGVVELAGFTDPIGSVNYNLGLSRQRAWAVQRYLVDHNVPLRSIHMVGLGKQTGPDRFGAEQQGATRKERDRIARRVSIRVYGASEIASANATDGQQE